MYFVLGPLKDYEVFLGSLLALCLVWPFTLAPFKVRTCAARECSQKKSHILKWIVRISISVCRMYLADIFTVSML